MSVTRGDGKEGGGGDGGIGRRTFLLALGTLAVGGAGLATWQRWGGWGRKEAMPGAPDLGNELFPDAKGRAIVSASAAPMAVMPRGAWTQETPNRQHMQVMNGVARITVHHTGFAHTWEQDGWKPTVAEIEHIRDFHTGTQPADRGWADIAYHFVIDHAGRVWQARPLAYQGAHVKGHNGHNAGIVLMGNFDVQRPSGGQLTALTDFLGFLRRIYQVPTKEVFTHGELGPTGCPGKMLQEYMNGLRGSWA